MPSVASDPVVQRPPRPEQLPGGAGVAAGEASGSFEGLLNGLGTETGLAGASSKPAGEATDKNSTELAAVLNPQQVNIVLFNGQFADTTRPAPQAIKAPPDNAPVLMGVLPAVTEAVAVEATSETKPAMTADADTAAPTPYQALESGDDTDIIIAVADAKAIDVAAAPIVAIAVPAPAPHLANPPPVTGPSAVPDGISPVELQALVPSAPTEIPSVPADAATPGPATPDAASRPATTPATADADGIVPIKPQAASEAATIEHAGKTTSADEAEATTAPKTAGLSETPEAKESTSPARAERKTEPGKARSDHSGGIARATATQPHLETAKPATDAAEQQPRPVQHPQRPQAVEPAPSTARSGATDARPELPAAAAPQAQIHAGGLVPFGLAVHTAVPHVALSPLAAQRVDAAADTAIPVAGLAVEIVSRAQDGLRRFDIRLDPPELGRIEVRLDVDTAGKVTSRLVVERAETLDLLRRDAPQLERALQHAGLNTEGGLEFSLRDQNFANREQTPRDVPATRLIIPDDEPAAVEAARRGYGRMIGLGGGVDIRV